jgi:hypothetical protein
LYSHRIDRETSARIDRLKKDITNLECDILTLPAVRAKACDELLEAIEDGTVKVRLSCDFYFVLLLIFVSLTDLRSLKMLNEGATNSNKER